MSEMIRRTLGGRIFDVFNYLFLTLLALTFIYPFWFMVLQSFSDPIDVNTIGFHIWSDTWNVEAYRYVLNNQRIGIAYLNSVFRTVVGTTVIVVVSLLAAYPLSKRRLPGRTIITIYFLVIMFFSGGLIPTYLVIRRLGMLNTRWALILPSCLNVFYVIIMRNFIMAIDYSLQESAHIDGASSLTILFRIIVPVARPVIATVALWAAVSHWNAWFDALIYISDDNKTVLQLLLRRMMELINWVNNLENWEMKFIVDIPPQSVQAAIALLTIGPIILIYPFAQRHFIKGIMIGSLKG